MPAISTSSSRTVSLEEYGTELGKLFTVWPAKDDIYVGDEVDWVGALFWVGLGILVAKLRILERWKQIQSEACEK